METQTKVKPIPEGYHTVTPYLVVNNLKELIPFLEKALNAEVIFKMEEEGRIRHAELKFGNSMVMFGGATDDYPPRPGMLYLYVENVDELYEQAIAAGAKSVSEVKDEFYGDRVGGVEDPSGNQWYIGTHVKDVEM